MTTIIVKHDIDITTAIPPRAPAQRYTPDRATMEAYEHALAVLVFKWTLFSQMIYSSMRVVYTRDVPLAATDSHSIFMNPEGLAAAGITDVLELVFVFAHEVGHRFFNDLVMSIIWRQTGQVLCPGGPLPYIHELMNMAEDYRINAMLVAGGIGKMPRSVKICYDPQISQAGEESCVEIYEKLFKQAEKEGRIEYVPGFDEHLEPSDEQVERDKVRREQEIVAAAQLAERVNPGNIPGAIQRLLGEILNPKIPWQQHLRATMMRKAGEPRLDWRQHNRRLAGRSEPMYFAKRGHNGAGPIAVFADNSGSISQHHVNVFAAEITGIITDLNPSLLVVIWCECQVTRVDELVEPDDLSALFADWRTAASVAAAAPTSPAVREARGAGHRP